ncbi:hypothetical protein [Pelagibius marinus]|uniref:hypothetical protein n=1 Tax=Pelagibius marinus TaxID=2762760 RepID=UPI0018729B79|nr:hypothetical protein [Pelagibius marinus]
MQIVVRRRTKAFLLAGLLTTATSCSFWAPTGSDITPDSVAESLTEGDLKAQYSLGEGAAYAHELREAYQSKIDEQFLLRNLADLAFIPIAGLATFYGISSAHTDVVLGLAIAGTSTYLAGQRFANSTDQLIYASGILSINCVLSSFEGQRYAYQYRDILIELVGGPAIVDGEPEIVESKILNQIAELKEAIAGLPGEKPQLVLDAEALIETAETVRSTTGRQAIGQIDSAGDQLVLAVSNVKAQVAQALINNALDAGRFRDAVQAAFRSSIPTVPKAADQPAAAAAPGVKHALNASQIESIQMKMAALEASIRTVREIAEFVSAPPSAESLKRCAVDVDAQGLTLAVSRSGPIVVSLEGGGTSLTKDVVVSFTISGGRQPYKAAWSGILPADLLEAPEITTGGVLTARLKTGLPQGAYELEILDSSQRTSPIVVKVQVGARPSTAETVTPEAEAQPDRTEVRKVQEFLRSTEFGANVTVKGEIDEATFNAIKEYLEKEEGIVPDAIASMPETELALKMMEIVKERVSQVQQFILDSGISSADDDENANTPEKPLVVDGDLGKITRAAISKYLSEEVGLSAAEVAQMDDAEKFARILELAKGMPLPLGPAAPPAPAGDPNSSGG